MLKTTFSLSEAIEQMVVCKQQLVFSNNTKFPIVYKEGYGIVWEDSMVVLSLNDLLINSTFQIYKTEISWRDVFDAKRIFPDPWDKCLKVAYDFGYNYIAFNGEVIPIRSADQKIDYSESVCQVEDLK